MGRRSFAPAARRDRERRRTTRASPSRRSWSCAPAPCPQHCWRSHRCGRRRCAADRRPLLALTSRHAAPATRTSSASTSARCPAARSSWQRDDGAELGTASHEYSARRDRRACCPPPARSCRRRGRCRTRRTSSTALRNAVPAARPAGGRRSRPRRRHRHRLHGIDADAGDARRHAAVRARRVPRPPARVPEAVEAPRRAAAGGARHRARAERGETWLPRYGGRISSEWEFAKALQVLEEDPRGLRRDGALDRGRRLDRLAALRRARRATSARRATRASTRTARIRRRLLARAQPGLRATSSATSSSTRCRRSGDAPAA